MAITRIEALSALPQALLMWPSRKKSLTILVTGRSHAGKSALINEIVGHKVALEAATLSRGTDYVQGYSFKYTGLDLRITLWDSPGLQDGSFRDEKYVSDMRSHGCADADLMLYCFNMNDTRFRQEDHDAIANLTTGLGKRIWSTAVFVMTFANRVMERPEQLHDFQHLLRGWKRRLIHALESTGVSVEISANIPVVPVGYNAKQGFPDREDWLESLWYESISRIQTSMFSESTHKESKRLLNLTLRAGFVDVTIIMCVVLGQPGVGKTCLKYLLLSKPPPYFRTSTICMEAPIRIQIERMSDAKSQSIKGKWREVKDEGMLDIIARMILLAEGDSSSGFDAEMIPKEAPVSILTKVAKWIANMAGMTAQTTSVSVEGSSVTSSTCQIAIKKIMDKLVQCIATLKSEEGQLKASSHPVTEHLLRSRSLWVYLSDCGGQPQYHELLPLFIRHISSALCVTRLTDKLDEIPVVEYYKEGMLVGVSQQSQLSAKNTIWSLLNTIQSYSDQDQPPSIIMVGTHLDQLEEQLLFSEANPEASSGAAAPSLTQPPRINETLEEKNKQLLEMLEPEFSDQLIYFSSDMKQLLFPLNAVSPGEREIAVAHSLRCAVEKSGAREVKIPIWWYVLEVLLQELAKELGRGVLSRAEYHEMARLLDIREESFDAALIYFNEFNVIKYFPKALPNVVFVDSQIPLDKISELVHFSYLLRQPVFVAEIEEPAFKKQFSDHGVVSDEYLEQFPRHYVPGIFMKEDLSQLLMSLLVFAEIPPPDWVKDTASAKQKYYAMLSLLPALPEAELKKYRVSSGIASTLLVRFPGGSRCAGVFCCCVTHLIQHCGWDPLFNSKWPIYRNCVRLQLITSPPCTIILIDSDTYIEVHVDTPSHSEYTGPFPIIRQTILSGIQAACNVLNYKTMKSELAFICPHSFPSPSPQHTATISKEKKYWHCDMQPRISGVLDERQSIWFVAPRVPQEASSARLDLPTPPTDYSPDKLDQPTSTDSGISSLHLLDAQPTLAKLSLLRTVDGKKINIISQLASVWYDLGIRMDFDECGTGVDMIGQTHHGNPRDCCRAIFQHWLRGNGVRPCSWRKLIELLDDCDQEVLAQEIRSALSASVK